jgi:hypothetical protein
MPRAVSAMPKCLNSLSHVPEAASELHGQIKLSVCMSSRIYLNFGQGLMTPLNEHKLSCVIFKTKNTAFSRKLRWENSNKCPYTSVYRCQKRREIMSKIGLAMVGCMLIAEVMFAYSISSVCLCTSQTCYWSAVVRYCKYKLTCSREKCPREPLHAEEIFSLGLTVITSRIQQEDGG